MTPVGPADVEAAVARIEGRIRSTPVIDLEVGDRSVVAKLEVLQHTGSFKPRGAFNRVLAATGDERERVEAAGLIAASGGNHGLAVAYVARALGLHAEIFVPEVTPAAKRDRIRALGASLVVGGALYQEALEASQARAAETGALEVHAYEHPAVVAGQGTLGRELEQQAQFDTVLVAVGGGGLIGGIAAWLAGRRRVVAVEPVGAAAMAAALAAGRPVDVEIDSVAADSLGARRVGEIAFDIARTYVERAVTVEDRDIRAAQHHLWEAVRVVAEPGGATALAAILSGAYRSEPGERVAVVVCGANTDPGTVGGG